MNSLNNLSKTEKLYYTDAYLSSFSASVLSSTPTQTGEYDTVLDKTAFFPEAGGQSSDTGRINGTPVTHVYEELGVIHHLTKEPVAEGEVVLCEVDFDLRFEKMQIHTAEHIISGFLNEKWGIENVGFHLGKEEITLDTDKPLTDEELAEAEAAANLAVYRNVPVTCFFPKAEEMGKIKYRSKMEIEEDLRLVEIEGFDICACCAPHVNMTGEIGFVKILSKEKHKGGTRVYFTAGKRAEELMRRIYDGTVKISNLLSSPVSRVAPEVEKLLSRLGELEYKISEKEKKIAAIYADTLKETDGNAVVILDGVGMDSVRLFCNLAGEKVGGTLVALTGNEGDYKYVIHNAKCDVGPIVKEANARLFGKGGGRGNMAQGTFGARIGDIKEFFK